MEDEENKKKAPSPPKTYTLKDVVQFENADIYSGFGRMTLSKTTTEPKYGFGKADRGRQQKVYINKALEKFQFAGKTSPGPNFEGTDFFDYSKDPEWIIGQAIRNTLDIRAPYDYYERIDEDTDEIYANNYRKNHAPTYRMGTEKRFAPSQQESNGVPGPKYQPNLKPEIPNSHKFSFGYRRDIPGVSPLDSLISTNPTVGPGSYHRKNCVPPNSSQQKNEPSHKFPQRIRFLDSSSKIQTNQTYEIYRSVADQTRSQKVSEPHINFTKAKREAKPGMFRKDMSTQPPKIRIPMPKI